jgi:hypothetical protein
VLRDSVGIFALLCFSCVPALPQETPFGQGAFQVLEKAACRACHNPDGVASVTRLHFPEADATPTEVERFGKSLVALVDRDRPAESLILKKPTNKTPHAGGVRITPGSADEKVLAVWVERLTKLSGPELESAMKYREETLAGRGKAAPKVAIRRLTHNQYNNTVRDLLGDQTFPANQFPPEDFVNGFKNQYQAQSISPLLLEAYSASAEKLARNAFRGGDTRGLLPCKPSVACRTRFVREFGLKAYRRPLEIEEQKRYETLMSRQPDFYKGAQMVVEAMLQSPAFLFRLEETAKPEWKQYAVANRLSYSVWDSMPDGALFDAAAKGQLSTPVAVEKTVRRLLDHTKAREALDEFVSQWLRFDRILTASKDRRRFPQFTRETAVAMTEEARIFLGDLVWNDRNFMDFVKAGHSFVNGDLAAIYGIPAPAKEYDRVEFPAGSERAGLLGQALFLALTAKPDETAPTARGLFVREQFLCQHVAEPPPGVNTNLPEITEAKPQTNRERLGAHLINPSCATCHNLIDPIGFGFEKFDAIGARREKFKLAFFPTKGGGGRRTPPKSVELDINSAGQVAGIPNSSFSSPLELGKILAESAQCQECVVKQYFRYTTGRMETPGDRALIKKALDDFRASQFRFKELIVSVLRSREFPNPGETAHVASNHQTR